MRGHDGKQSNGKKFRRETSCYRGGGAHFTARRFSLTKGRSRFLHNLFLDTMMPRNVCVCLKTSCNRSRRGDWEGWKPAPQGIFTLWAMLKLR